jgi:predicted nucleotidyltransferase
MRPDPPIDLILARFVAACGSDDRILGAFVGGSRASGKADEYSDLDLCLIARDDARDQLWAERAAFSWLPRWPRLMD